METMTLWTRWEKIQNGSFVNCTEALSSGQMGVLGQEVRPNVYKEHCDSLDTRWLMPDSELLAEKLLEK
jgi:hypothetical protein